MEGDAVSATIGVLVQNLITLSKDEMSLIRGLEGDAEKLSDTFGMIQSFLEDAQTKSITEAAVKTWLKKLQEKAFDADNALDELNYQFLYNKRKKKVPCFPSFYYCVQRRDLAIRINKINTSFESINKNATELGLQGKLAAATAAVPDAALETNSVAIDPIFVGRDHDVMKIVEMLMIPTEETVSILPLVGMGGLGKTTLARKVFNHEKIKTHYGKHIWVQAPQDFDVGDLLKKILTNLDQENVEVVEKKDREALEAQNGGNVEVVLKNIQQALKAKTYLIVLDDVWNDDQQKWDEFIRSWSGITSTKGNCIIVTTRNVGVGLLVQTLDLHLLNGLSDEQCFSIIKNKAFDRGAITLDVEDFGRSIAKRCHGLPLATNAVGGALRGKLRDEWHSIKENWLPDVERDGNYISRILKLSFHHLSSSSLKKCFAYCSIFPKGARIYRNFLIELWMAKGFLQPSQTSDMETVGNQILKVLLHNSLLQVVNRNIYGEVQHCSMHDLVHDVASSISNDIYYKRNEPSRIPKEQGKWSICWGSNEDESNRITKVQAKSLRTLIYNGRICDIVFSNFKSLHALTLTDDDVKKLPDSITGLIHLRYLDISYTSIRYLPDSVSKLSNLQTIRYLHPLWRSGLKKLPCTLKYLFNLRHLYIADDDTKLPSQLGSLTSLQTLPFFKVRNKEGHRIVELESMKNLKGELKIYHLENVQGEEKSTKACLFQKPGIMRLVLRWVLGREGQVNDENVLKGLQPHPNLKVLEINGFKAAMFPTWTSKMAVFFEGHWVGLSSLMDIRLESCPECEEIPALGHLPNLKFLYLSGFEKVKSIGASFYGVEEYSYKNGFDKEKISVFPVLEWLQLQDMHNLVEWEEVKIPSGAQVTVFPCLEFLRIVGCNELRSAPSQFTSLKELNIVQMKSELPLASICGFKLKTLTKLLIVMVKELISLPHWLFHNNQHLSSLAITWCSELKELPDGLHSLNSLEELVFQCCDNLKSIPFSASGKKLQDLASLRKLSICGREALISFVSGMEESCAPLLEELTIGADYSDAWNCASFKKAADGILRFKSHSLLRLGLIGKETHPAMRRHLTAPEEFQSEPLPNQLQHLTALVELQLISFGIDELPEWFGNFSRLQYLRLYTTRLSILLVCIFLEEWTTLSHWLVMVVGTGIHLLDSY